MRKEERNKLLNIIIKQFISYVTNYLHLKPAHSHVLYIDESGFSLSLRRFFGRSPVGKRANLKVRAIRSQNLSLIATVSKEKVWSTKVHEGSVNQHVFSEYLIQLFVDLQMSGISKALLIMDNVRFHKTEYIMDLVAETSHSILFLPPYSPFLNPIEELFNQWKIMVRNKKPTTKNELIEAIQACPSDITQNQCQNYCNHAESYFLRCLNNENIEN